MVTALWRVCVDAWGLSISPAMYPLSSQMVVWLKKGELPRVVTKYGTQIWTVPFTPGQQGSYRVKLMLAFVPGILTIMRRMITEPSCRRW